MRVSVPHRFVYLSTPKAGTHTICKLLEEFFPKGLMENGLHNVNIPSCYARYSRWTVVRNPYSRAVSLWWSACRLCPEDIYGFRKGCGAAEDFRKFILWLASTPMADRFQEPLMLSQAEWLRPVEPVLAIHLEQLEEGLASLPFWRDGIMIPKLNTTTEKILAQSRKEQRTILRPRWQDYCRSQQIQDAVMEWAGEDFERFGYSVEVEP